MAARTRSSGTEISLFPFLSILACLIGSLTLIISVLAISQVLNESQDSFVERAEKMIQMEKNGKEAAVAIEKEKLNNKTRAEAMELEKQIAELKKLLDPNLEEPDPEKLGELEKLLEGKREELEKLDEEMKKKVPMLAELTEEMSKGKILKILPSTSGYFRRVSPLFMEAGTKELVIHSPSKVVKVPLDKINTDKNFETAARWVAESKRRIIIFLVRSTGRSTYFRAERRALELGALTSKLPLSGDGDLDLSAFLNR